MKRSVRVSGSSAQGRWVTGVHDVEGVSQSVGRSGRRRIDTKKKNTSNFYFFGKL